jgi:hypothetical protein
MTYKLAGLAVLLPIMGQPVAAQPISVPSDPRASYTALAIRPLANGRVEITTQRIGPSGTSFAVREIDCRTRSFRYLGEGDTRAAAEARRSPSPTMGALFQGSISDHVAAFACRGIR